MCTGHWGASHILPSANYSCGVQCFSNNVGVNTSNPDDAYMRQWIGSLFLHVMTCRLTDAKLSPKPMQCRLVAVWNFVNKFQWKFNHKKDIKLHLKLSPAKWRPFCLGRNILSSSLVITCEWRCLGYYICITHSLTDRHCYSGNWLQFQLSVYICISITMYYAT